MKIHNVEQRSQEWLNLRKGAITGTRLKGVLASNNLPLIDELISEELTIDIPFNFVNEAMQRGIDLEPLALSEYQVKSFQIVESVGFIECTSLDGVGLSPDGLIKDEGIYKGAVEIKCPSSKKHIEYIRTDKIPAEYKAQILMYFICVDTLEWLDFVSFDNRVEAYPIHILRVTRQELNDEINEAFAALIKFNAKKEKYFNQIFKLEK